MNISTLNEKASSDSSVEGWYKCLGIAFNLIATSSLYLSQKQLPRKMKSRLVIIEYAGYIFWLLFLQQL